MDRVAHRARRVFVVAMAAAVAVMVSGWFAAQADAFVYWANFTNGTIGRADLDGTGVNQNFIFGAGGPSSVAVDSQHIYWTNLDADTIGRANLDGTGVDQNFITTGNNPVGVAVDGQHMYWSDSGGIGRANLDGTGGSEGFIPASTGAGNGVAVDSRYIYWAHGIGRANLDGSGVDGSFIGALDPMNVAVDGQHVYWSEPSENQIGRANVDGTGVTQDFITGATNPDGVASYGQYVYWTSTGVNTIGRANLDGTGVNENFITGAAGPFGVAVDALLPPPTATITIPANGATYAVGQVVDLSFSCSDTGGPGVTSCLDQTGHPSGTPIDTSTTGAHTLTVTATSSDGQTGTASVTYTVAAAPTVSITTPASGAMFTFGESVGASFSCAEGSGGPGIASCSGTVADGAAIDTTTPGTHVFAVTATSKDGQARSASSMYTVLAPTPVLAPSPVLGDLKASHPRWRDGSALAQISSHKKRPPVGTTFSFTLNEAATVNLVFTQQAPGRLVNVKGKSRCVAQTEHDKRMRKCMRNLTAGGMALRGHIGTDKISFDGRVSHADKLRVGSYTTTITATNASGESSKPQSLRFTIVN